MISFLASLWSVLRPSRFTFVSFVADVANKDWYITTYEHRVKTYFYVLPSFFGTFYQTLQWSRRSNRSGVSVCVCLSVCRTVTFKLSDIWSRYLARWFNSTISRSSSKVKVLGQSSPSHEAIISYKRHWQGTDCSIRAYCTVKRCCTSGTSARLILVNWTTPLSIYQFVQVWLPAFAYAGPTTWNSLHDFLRNVNRSLSAFKRHLKDDMQWFLVVKVNCWSNVFNIIKSIWILRNTKQ